jgi:hypothetical protein
MRVNFKTQEQYTEAWMYLMRTCSGFTYCRDARWIEPTAEGVEEDEWTIARLTDIASDEWTARRLQIEEQLSH